MAGLHYNDYLLGCVSDEHFDEVWEKIVHFLEPAMVETWGVITIEDLRIICKTGHSQLWVVTHKQFPVGAFVTKVQQASKHRILDIEYLGGADFKKWGIDLMKIFEDNAKEQGIDIIRICGRRGWAKLFQDYKEQSHIIAKVL